MKTFTTYCFLILFLVFSSELKSQETVIILKDKTTKLPVSDAHININNQNIISNNEGKAIINIENSYKNIKISHISYNDTVIEAKNITNNFTIFLTPMKYLLPMVSVNYNYQIVFKDDNYSVLDFELIGENLLLLVYKYRLYKSCLVYLKSNGDTITYKNLVGKSEKLEKDCFNNVHLKLDNKMFQIVIDDNMINLKNPIEMEEYDYYFSGCVASIDEKTYFNFNYYHGFINKIYYVNDYKKDKTTYSCDKIVNAFDLPIYTMAVVTDSFKIKEFEREYSFFYYAKLYKQGFSKNEIKELRKMQPIDWVDYTGRFSPSPIEVRTFGNNIAVFNYTYEKLEFYDKNNVLLNKIDINFLKNKKWTKEIYIDENQNRIYTTFMKNGITYCNEISLKDGNTNELVKIPYQFISEIKINNDIIYFLYKDIREGEKQKLFKYRLPQSEEALININS